MLEEHSPKNFYQNHLENNIDRMKLAKIKYTRNHAVMESCIYLWDVEERTYTIKSYPK